MRAAEEVDGVEALLIRADPEDAGAGGHEGGSGRDVWIGEAGVLAAEYGETSLPRHELPGGPRLVPRLPEGKADVE